MSRLDEIKERVKAFRHWEIKANECVEEGAVPDLEYLIARVERLEGALRFYSDPQEYFKDLKEVFPRNEAEGVVYISGEVARKALAEELK